VEDAEPDVAEPTQRPQRRIVGDDQVVVPDEAGGKRGKIRCDREQEDGARPEHVRADAVVMHAAQGIETLHVIGTSLPFVSLAWCTLQLKSAAVGAVPPQLVKFSAKRRGGGIALIPLPTTMIP